MRISDWSSDVCSSDLRRTDRVARQKGRECDEGFDSSVQGDVDDRFGKRCADVGIRVDRACPGKRRCREYAGERHGNRRSEEHTSELQSLMRISYAVFCLKKKTTENNEDTQTKKK